jgi:hypothetical protein
MTLWGKGTGQGDAGESMGCPPTKIAGQELARHIGDLPRHLAPLTGKGVEISLR